MVSLIINNFANFIHFTLGLLPAGSPFPAEVHSAFITLGGYMHTLDSFIPFEALLWCLTAIFSVEIAIFGFKTFKWLVSHLPFIGGKGV